MKTKKYAILAFILLTSVLTVCFAGRAIPKTLQLEKNKKTDSNLTALHKLALSAKRVRSDEKEILQGLEGVHVLVEPMRPGVEEYGLTRKDLQTDTELQLRQYGIKVLTEKERLLTIGRPILHIDATVIMREEVPIVAAVVTFELRENVLLLREPTRICAGASTWRKSGVALVGSRRIKDIRGAVKGYVNEFINDYLAANPKESPVKEEEEKPKDD